MALEAKHYQETRDRLKADPIIRAMVDEIPADQEGLVHSSGTPTFGFMTGANEEYARRGGQVTGHIGAVAEAVLALRADDVAAAKRRHPAFA